jgi:rSAM/selenodomain-associated transferase 2
MTAPVSIVIPTYNSADILPFCLASVFEGMADGLICEVIFADGGSSDTTKEIATEAGVLFLPCPKGRGSQLSAGIKAAKGDWLLILHSDTFLSDGWTQTVFPLLANPSKARFFKLRFNDMSISARLVAFWANLRSKFLGLPFGDQGLLISRGLYDQVGGYEDIPLMEDVAIARALRGHKQAAFDITATTGADRYLREGWFKRSLRNFWLLFQYKLGRSPANLAHHYQPNQRSEEH